MIYFTKFDSSLLVRKSQSIIELYNRHKARISKEEINFGINISEIKNYIKVEFLSLKDDSNLKTVIDFLEAVENASQKGIIDDLLASGNFNIESLKNPVEQLLERWIISYDLMGDPNDTSMILP